MNFIKRFKGVLICVGIFAIVLAISFYCGEQEHIGTDVVENELIFEDNSVETEEPLKIETKEKIVQTQTPVAPLETIVPTPMSVAPLETKEPTEAIEENNTKYCTLTVRCDTILNNLEKVSPEKISVIPENGNILSETELEFADGETVFDVLERTLRNKKIHFEFTKAPMYDSIYIEGIGNLYEFDAGNLSGWIYRVNGKTPSLGCSQYKLAEGDKIEFLYTCNMGRDL